MISRIIASIVAGIVLTFVGIFIGLQVSTLVADILLFPGGIIIALIFNGFASVPFGPLLVVVLQCFWWFAIFSLIGRLRGSMNRY